MRNRIKDEGERKLTDYLHPPRKPTGCFPGRPHAPCRRHPTATSHLGRPYVAVPPALVFIRIFIYGTICKLLFPLKTRKISRY